MGKRKQPLIKAGAIDELKKTDISSPASDTSAFSRMRAFVKSWAERLPLGTVA
jgi:hypothetical protein